jgi:tetrahydromethanopterin S-methyltransferase subunit A
MILHEGLVSRAEHAAYLGKELARAEEALKSGREYIQE